MSPTTCTTGAPDGLPLPIALEPSNTMVAKGTGGDLMGELESEEGIKEMQRRAAGEDIIELQRYKDEEEAEEHGLQDTTLFGGQAGQTSGNKKQHKRRRGG
eukprot:TRINITY_DN4341_c0_g4_i1.p4 TRINITY_DN4341_c0_g4~~TRINITY_DN4341_c0_g4_i1.p4  ORF type:complete len:101 (+),score=30.88 TRINITY_DN4341_c0_g4_i1:3048-3350(+)